MAQEIIINEGAIHIHFTKDKSVQMPTSVLEKLIDDYIQCKNKTGEFVYGANG